MCWKIRITCVNCRPYVFACRWLCGLVVESPGRSAAWVMSWVRNRQVITARFLLDRFCRRRVSRRAPAMSPRLESLVDDGERALPPGRRNGAIAAAVVGGAFGPAAIPVQADAVITYLTSLLAAVVTVRFTMGNVSYSCMRGIGLMGSWKANVLDAGRSLFATLDLSAFTLPAEASVHVLIGATAAGR